MKEESDSDTRPLTPEEVIAIERVWRTEYAAPRLAGMFSPLAQVITHAQTDIAKLVETISWLNDEWRKSKSYHEEVVGDLKKKIESNENRPVSLEAEEKRRDQKLREQDAIFQALPQLTDCFWDLIEIAERRKKEGTVFTDIDWLRIPRKLMTDMGFPCRWSIRENKEPLT